MNKKILHLVNLLDDEDEQSASFVMAELLTYENDLDEVLQEIQETNNNCLRRRVHQLQSIQSLRRRRKSLSLTLKKKDVDLFEGLCEIHFLWYDNDSGENIQRFFDDLVKKAEKYRPDNLEKLAYFMRKSDFNATSNEDFDADFFCIGIVLEDLIGADFILCAIAQKIAKLFNLDLKIIKITGAIALLDEKTNSVLMPQRDWHIFQLHKAEKYTVWSTEQLLKHTVSLLFYCAVSTDSFRYIYTIGNCLAEISGKSNIDFLPYPLNTTSNAAHN